MADRGLAPMIGIVEVAALAGVSPATVPRALRGLPGVSVATRENVEQAAAELGYVASPSAAALTTGRTSAIGVLAPWISRWFFSAVIERAQEVVGEQRYDTLLYSLGANAGPDTSRSTRVRCTNGSTGCSDSSSRSACSRHRCGICASRL